MAEIIHTHTHPVVDTARPFTIDPNTKEVKPGTNNLVLAQHSKDSERFTFSIPGTTIEGHDMTACNSVMVHFQNIGQNGERSAGIYAVSDLAVDGESVRLSWLIDDDATRFAGGLIFSIHFACVADDGTLVYNFPTLTFSKITVGATVWNSETIAQEYPDIITEFNARIADLETKMANGGGGGSSEPGFSPIAKVTQTESGAVISITDKSGTTKVTITNGKTPAKGTDYFTEADKAEMVSAVIAALPDASEVEY